MTEKDPKKAKIIIGIDPGTRVSGFGIIRVQGHLLQPLDFGCIRPPAHAQLSDRYLILFESIKALLKEYEPDEMAIETPFVSAINAQGAIKLGIALGMALISAKERKMKVFGYTPREVKCAVTGTGKASKDQVQMLISRLLQLKTPPKPQDASDALAIAICHAHTPDKSFMGSKKKNSKGILCLILLVVNYIRQRLIASR